MGSGGRLRSLSSSGVSGEVVGGGGLGVVLQSEKIQSKPRGVNWREKDESEGGNCWNTGNSAISCGGGGERQGVALFRDRIKYPLENCCEL